MMENSLKEIFDAYEGLVFICNEQGEIDWVNDFALDKFNFKRKDLRALTLESLGLSSEIIEDSSLLKRVRSSLSYQDKSFDTSVYSYKFEDKYLILARYISDENLMNTRYKGAIDSLREDDEKKALEVAKGNQQIVEIFSNLGVAVAVFNRDGIVQSFKTEATDEIFDHHKGNHISDTLVHLKTSEKNLLRRCVKTNSEGMWEIEDDFAFGMLPKEYCVDKNTYQLDYFTLSDNCIAVITRDITQLEDSQRKIEYILQRGKILSMANQDLSKFRALKSEALNLFESFELGKFTSLTDLKRDFHDLRQKFEEMEMSIIKTKLIKVEKNYINKKLEPPKNLMDDIKHYIRSSFEDIECDLDLSNTAIKSWRMKELRKLLKDSILLDGVSTYDIVHSYKKRAFSLAEDLGKCLDEIKCTGVNVLIDERYRHMLSSIVLNFLLNAIVHGIEEERDELSKPEYASITIDTSVDGRDLIMSFKDDGKGIDLDETPLEKLIESEFSTYEGSESVAGAGVGLSSIHSLIKNHGGSLQVESKLGQWTKFTVVLENIVEMKLELP